MVLGVHFCVSSHACGGGGEEVVGVADRNLIWLIGGDSVKCFNKALELIHRMNGFVSWRGLNGMLWLIVSLLVAVFGHSLLGVAGLQACPSTEIWVKYGH